MIIVYTGPRCGMQEVSIVSHPVLAHLYVVLHSVSRVISQAYRQVREVKGLPSTLLLSITDIHWMYLYLIFMKISLSCAEKTNDSSFWAIWPSACPNMQCLFGASTSRCEHLNSPSANMCVNIQMYILPRITLSSNIKSPLSSTGRSECCWDESQVFIRNIWYENTSSGVHAHTMDAGKMESL